MFSYMYFESIYVVARKLFEIFDKIKLTLYVFCIQHFTCYDKNCEDM